MDILRKLLNLIAIVIVGGVVATYFTLGPSFLMGGPKNSDIVNVSRAVIVATAAGSNEAELAKTAKISPKGFCNHANDGSYACAVEIEINGTAPSTVISVLKKGNDGIWVAAE